MKQNNKHFEEGIRRLNLQTGPNGKIQSLSVVFGPHHFIELEVDGKGRPQFTMGCTHHGFKADASAINGELEKIIWETRGNHPDKLVD